MGKEILRMAPPQMESKVIGPCAINPLSRKKAIKTQSKGNLAIALKFLWSFSNKNLILPVNKSRLHLWQVIDGI